MPGSAQGHADSPGSGDLNGTRLAAGVGVVDEACIRSRIHSSLPPRHGKAVRPLHSTGLHTSPTARNEPMGQQTKIVAAHVSHRLSGTQASAAAGYWRWLRMGACTSGASPVRDPRHPPAREVRGDLSNTKRERHASSDVSRQTRYASCCRLILPPVSVHIFARPRAWRATPAVRTCMPRMVLPRKSSALPTSTCSTRTVSRFLAGLLHTSHAG